MITALHLLPTQQHAAVDHQQQWLTLSTGALKRQFHVCTHADTCQAWQLAVLPLTGAAVAHNASCLVMYLLWH